MSHSSPKVLIVSLSITHIHFLCLILCLVLVSGSPSIADQPTEFDVATENGLGVDLAFGHLLGDRHSGATKINLDGAQDKSLASALSEFWLRGWSTNRVLGYPILEVAVAEAGSFGLVAGCGRKWELEPDARVINSVPLDFFPKEFEEKLKALHEMKVAANQALEAAGINGVRESWSLQLEYQYKLMEVTPSGKSVIMVSIESVFNSIAVEENPLLGIKQLREVVNPEARDLLGKIKLNVLGIDFESDLRRRYRDRFPVFLPGDALLVTSLGEAEGSIDIEVNAQAIKLDSIPTTFGQLKYGLRKWRDITGKFSVDAFLENYRSGKVHLQSSNGKKIVVPLAKLCGEDKKLIREYVETEKADQIDSPYDDMFRPEVRANRIEGMLVLRDVQEHARANPAKAKARASNLKLDIPSKPIRRFK